MPDGLQVPAPRVFIAVGAGLVVFALSFMLPIWPAAAYDNEIALSVVGSAAFNLGPLLILIGVILAIVQRRRRGASTAGAQTASEGPSGKPPSSRWMAPTALLLGLIAAWVAWTVQQTFVDSREPWSSLSLLALPLALVVAAVGAVAMRRRAGPANGGQDAVAAVLGFGGAVLGIALLWFGPILLFGGT